MWVFKAGSRSKFGRKGYLESQNETDEMVDNFTLCIADVSLSDGYLHGDVFFKSPKNMFNGKK
jgi:hypothetical protein